MPELDSLGSVRGALRNERPYRELKSEAPSQAQAAVAARHLSNASPLMSWRPALDQRRSF